MIYATIPQDNANLRHHQIEAKSKILSAWDSYSSVMLQMPTGTGKTYLFTSLIKDLLSYYKQNHLELNILIVAHRMELLDQISQSLGKYGIPHGFIQGNREQHLWQRIQVGSILSLLTSKNEMNVQRLDFDYIIVDEAHHSLAETYKKLFDTFPRAKKLGVTATPWRLNHESFTPLYEHLITTPQVSWFINNGLLSDFEYVSIKPDSEVQKMINNTQISTTGDFVNEDLDITFNNQRIRSKLFESYHQFAYKKKGVIYAINRQHALNIAAMYSSKGIAAVAIDCETPKEERQNLIQQFKEGKISVLVNVNIFTEGFDCPDISFIQLARPTRSLALFLQQVGRGLRVANNKEKTIILDNVGLYNYFGLPDANRNWLDSFIGWETEELDYADGSKKDTTPFLEESEHRDDNFNEDDEEMLIIKGAKNIIEPTITHDRSSDYSAKPLAILESSLCGYYLIRGNYKKFKVYPFIRKRGKETQDVGACLYEYDEDSTKIEFNTDLSHNLLVLSQDAKAQTIVSFACALIQKPIKSVLNLTKPYSSIEKPLQDTTTLYDLLRMIEEIYQRAS